VRQFVRDFVDVRRNVAQYLLPLLLVILVLSLIPRLFAVQLVVWALTIALTLLDTIWLGHRLRTELRTRFEPTQTKGAMSYGLLRSTQLRRLRLPRARLGYGDKLPARY
jgi:ABC-type amino acid transport system permease subunit